MLDAIGPMRNDVVASPLPHYNVGTLLLTQHYVLNSQILYTPCFPSTIALIHPRHPFAKFKIGDKLSFNPHTPTPNLMFVNYNISNSLLVLKLCGDVCHGLAKP